MKKSNEEIDAIKEKCKPQIDQMNKMLLNMYAVSNIRFWYSCLRNFRKTSDIHKDIMKMEAFTTSIIVSYGRIFGSGTGTTILKEKIIPKDLLCVHKQIIDLRHAKYAHHGELSTFEKNIQVEYNDFSFIVIPKVEVEFCLGAPKEWAPLFEWLDEFIYDRLQNMLTSLTRDTGVEWSFPNGPAPSWIR